MKLTIFATLHTNLKFRRSQQLVSASTLRFVIQTLLNTDLAAHGDLNSFLTQLEITVDRAEFLQQQHHPSHADSTSQFALR